MRLMPWIILAALLNAGCAPAASPVPTHTPASSTTPIVSTAAEVLPGQTAAPEVTPLPNGPRAPQINNTVWLNTEPLTPDRLNGQVVLIDFWTFG
jgi:hypothetical protein